ncbi:hypothetical protein [Tahibacter sp.]|uniref:hypothetical protein n=1 Tax=Tahibacter sp. TaxID=2056211 RepID=UPI0028C3E3D1|nr:hypothetical protein [Tahibacter sp.]
MKYVVLLLGLLLGTMAMAQSARFGSRMVSRGDTAERVREVAGSPDSVESEPTESGQREQWTYRRRGRLIQLWIADGKVVHVSDRKDE